MIEYITLKDSLRLPYLPKQDEFFYTNTDKKFKSCGKGRRFGVTRGAAHYCIEALLEGKSILWVDTIQPNLDSYVAKYFMPAIKQLKPSFWRYRTQHKDLTLVNTTMDFRSAENPHNIEGFGYHIIILNEAGIILKGKKGRDMWFNSIYPMTMDFNAKVFFLGTPKGKRSKKDEGKEKNSLYYQLACKGGLVNGHPENENYLHYEYSSYDNPTLSLDVIREIEEDVPFVVRKQEIYGKFIDAGAEEVFKEDWFNVVYELPPVHLWRRKIISIDTAFKKGCENDDSAGICILETEVGYYITDMFCEKMEFPELIKRTTEFCKRNKPNLLLIEDKASGTSLIQMFRREILYQVSIKPITPVGDKFARAVACTPIFQNGMVHLYFGKWNDQYKAQLCDFNFLLDTPDDLVDATSQGFNYFKVKGGKSSPPPVRRKVERKSKILKGY